MMNRQLNQSSKTVRNIRNKGLVLALVMAAVVILFVAGVALLEIGFQSRLLAVRRVSEIEARSAADAGLTKALYAMNQKLKTKPWSDATLPVAQDEALLASDADFSYNVTGNSTSGYTLTATGNFGDTIRTVHAKLGTSGSLPYGVLTKGKLYFKNNVTVTGSCGTLSSASGDFDIGKGEITGDAFVGVGGNPSNIKCKVDGEKYALDSPITLDMPAVPSSASSAGPNTNWTTPNNAVIGTDGTTTYCQYTGLSINGTLTVKGNVVMYVNGSLSDLGSGINVAANSTLKLYVSGDLGPGGNGVDLSSTSNDPSSLKIYGVGSGTQNFTLGKNKATTVATIYAPNADVTIGKNKAVLVGSCISNSFSAKNNADVTYDSRSNGNCSVDDPGARFVINNWSE